MTYVINQINNMDYKVKSFDNISGCGSVADNGQSKGRFNRVIYWILLLAVLFLGFVGTAIAPPLTDVHWDSPIHLYHGKRFAQTDLLAEYAEFAPTIASKVSGTTVINPDFWSPYWRFIRLGHTILVGSTVKASGANETTIMALKLLFSGMISLAALMAVTSSCTLARLLNLQLPYNKVLLGSMITAALFVLSDIYGYLGRSVVSETPAMLLLVAAIQLFLLGQLRSSLVWSGLSGVLAFCSYVVRVDVIWPYLTFILVLAIMQWKYESANFWRQGYLIALLTSFVCWLAYLIWVYPLPSPQYIIAFAKTSDIDPGEVSLFRLTESVGLLLIGAVLNLTVKGANRTWAFPMVWAAMALLPSISYLIEERSVQTRMFVPYLVIPIFIASSFGWAKLFSYRPSNFRSIGLIVAGFSTGLVVAATQPIIYEHLRAMPGLWRIQSINNFLKPLLLLPAYEKLTFDMHELKGAANAITAMDYEVPVVGGNNVRPGDLYLLNYFMTDYPANAQLLMNGEPVSEGHCAAKPNKFEKHSLCVNIKKQKMDGLINDAGAILLLERASDRSASNSLRQTSSMIQVFSGKLIQVWLIKNNH